MISCLKVGGANASECPRFGFVGEDVSVFRWLVEIPISVGFDDRDEAGVWAG